jgi:hypothetical protein
MEQLEEFSAHLKGNTLDLILTNIPERVVEVMEEGLLGKSNNAVIVTRVTLGRTEEKRSNWHPTGARRHTGIL